MSKLTKFRNSPRQFFADSRHEAVRAAGRLLVPHLLGRESVLSLLEDPVEGLLQGRIPGLRAAAGGLARRAARRRRARLAAAGEPLVSVVVAARNAAGTIERSLASLLRQTYRRLEILVVDDASDDQTAPVVASVAAQSGRVELVRLSRQRGPAAARNVGLSRARGAYLAFQDADDVSHPERIERQLAALLASRDAVACVCNYCRETPEGRRVTVNGRRLAKGAITMLFAREPVFTRLGYMLDLPLAEDAEYAERVRAFFGDERELYLFQTLYRARFSPDSLLFSSGETTITPGQEVSHLRSEAVERDVRRVSDRIEAIRARQLDPFVAFADENSDSAAK